LVLYRTIPGIVSFFSPAPDWSDAGQSGIPSFIHTNMHTNTHINTHTNTHIKTHINTHTNTPSHTHTDLWWTGENMDRNMDVQHGHGDVQDHRCRNADKKFSPASLVFR
jgi:hypothetical protein